MTSVPKKRTTQRRTPVTDRGRRMALTYSLDSRTRRQWVRTLMAKQEAVENAEAELAKAMLQAYEAGMSYNNIGGALSLHPTTVQGFLDDIRKGDQGSSEDSQ